ncbi:hypothetical protein [Herbidospora yilanensis]|uniref:hypothetical protein n=1 Tax=Herbidospora yilanensis TaxID=354426 RepID=UPI0007864E4D|nr:hypothetical protein [Herbidospora yilanensis]
MLTFTKQSVTRLAAAAFAAAAVATAAAPASAATGPSGTVNFYADAWFTTQIAAYDAATLGTGCHALPSVAHAEWNDSDVAIQVYATADCTGSALYFPANDIHSFVRFDARSFRIA